MEHFFFAVIPAKAGIHWLQELRDPRFRGDDGKLVFFDTLESGNPSAHHGCWEIASALSGGPRNVRHEAIRLGTATEYGNRRKGWRTMRGEVTPTADIARSRRRRGNPLAPYHSFSPRGEGQDEGDLLCHSHPNPLPQEGVDKWIISTFPSFLRRQESIGFRSFGIPAFAGMTANRCFSTPSKGEKEFNVPRDSRLRSLFKGAVYWTLRACCDEVTCHLKRKSSL